ncbi:hypothetical protein HWV62_9265 [Athelia sp. TMB]|nr:hypothetical protein HWV62_9265 [Athelia sp. TMB]
MANPPASKATRRTQQPASKQITSSAAKQTSANLKSAPKRKAGDENAPVDDTTTSPTAETSKRRKEALANTNPRSSEGGPDRGDDGDVAIADQYTAMKAALEKAERRNRELQQQLNEAAPTRDHEETDLMEKPKGSGWNIQIAMGLRGKGTNRDKYKAIQLPVFDSKRAIRDLALNAGIEWEVSWRDVPSSKKAMLYDVCRERHPYLARFKNDWATEAIVKQYLGNKRQRAYDMGWLEPPEKYAYLKVNASKRNSTSSRKSKALVDASSTRKPRRKTSQTKSKRRPVNDEDEPLRFPSSSESGSGDNEGNEDSDAGDDEDAGR